MKRIIPYILLSTLLLTGGCVRDIFGGDDDWYSGPSEYKGAVQDAVNLALAELPRELGRPLKWNWNGDYKIRLQVVPAAGKVGGVPYFISGDGRKTFGEYNGVSIKISVGAPMGPIRHEVGHAVMGKNGYPYHEHHDLAPAFYRRHSGNHR
jgi:hypothetical protein